MITNKKNIFLLNLANQKMRYGDCKPVTFSTNLFIEQMLTEILQRTLINKSVVIENMILYAINKFKKIPLADKIIKKYNLVNCISLTKKTKDKMLDFISEYDISKSNSEFIRICLIVYAFDLYYYEHKLPKIQEIQKEQLKEVEIEKKQSEPLQSPSKSLEIYPEHIQNIFNREHNPTLKRVIECRYCSQIFAMWSSYQAHLYAKHQDQTEIYACNRCGILFATRTKKCKHQADCKYSPKNIMYPTQD